MRWDIYGFAAAIVLLLAVLSFNFGRMFEQHEARTALLKCKAGQYCKIGSIDVAIDAFGYTKDLRERE